MRLADKVAIVTGAGRGLGRAIAVAYAREGARVIAVDCVESELSQAGEIIKAEGGQALPLLLDLAEDSAVREMVARTLKEYGRVDVLANCAARLPHLTLEEMPFDNWDLTLAVNLRAPALACKLCIEPMKQQGGGSMINVSSRGGIEGHALETDYCASKFGLEGFSQALAIELQPYNIAVNTVSPGGGKVRVRIKPTSMTLAQFDALSPEERAIYGDPMIMTDGFVYLALQDGHGVTGRRLQVLELSERIHEEGWALAV